MDIAEQLGLIPLHRHHVVRAPRADRGRDSPLGQQGIHREDAPLQQGAPLSRREKECLLAASRGLTSADIGYKLGITERTVHFHFGNIFSKLAAANRAEAIATALARGMIGT